MLTNARKILSERDPGDALVLVGVIEVYLQVDDQAAAKIQKIEEIVELYRTVVEDLDDKLQVCFARRLLEYSLMLEEAGRIEDSVDVHDEFINYVVTIRDEDASENLIKESQTRAKSIMRVKK